MSTKSFISGLLVILMTAVTVPAVFFAVPQRASAQASAISCVSNLLGGAATGVKDLLGVPVSNLTIQTETTITGGATLGNCLDTTILKPLARMLARIVLQQITASTINWITGKNGSGKPSFVTNLSVNLQGVGDAVALPFIARISTGFNSPFGLAISSSLQTKYLQQTSLAGFFSANQCTLSRSSSNPNAFIAGDWSKGGIPEWFALTTQTQNNPYTLYQAAESQVQSSIGQAQTNRRQDIVSGSGFLSWCGTTAAADQTQGQASSGYQACIAQCDANGYTAACADSCTANFSQSGGSIGGATSSGVNPGASCTNSDGTPGNIQTPGSVLHDYTSKAVVGAGIDQLVSAQDLDQALGAIAMALVNQVLGSGGLLGASSPSSSSRPAITTQLQGYSGDTTSSSGSAVAVSQSALARLATYTSAWQTIVKAEQVASSTVTQLLNACPNQASAAQAALTTELAPVLAQAQSAFSSYADTRALALKVQAESTATNSPTNAATLSADTQLLAIAPPTSAEVAATQQNAQVSGGARANPAGSLNVSSGTLVDQMNLIGANASALLPNCGIITPLIDNTFQGTGG